MDENQGVLNLHNRLPNWREFLAATTDWTPQTWRELINLAGMYVRMYEETARNDDKFAALVNVMSLAQFAISLTMCLQTDLHMKQGLLAEKVLLAIEELQAAHERHRTQAIHEN